MNCKHVQELLPLFVGRDLEEERAKLVTAHLQSCAKCAGAADEYRETRQLLQQFAPPPFSEEVYTGIRQRVLREIARESPESIGPSLPQLVGLFRPRLRWAIATALVLAFSIFAFYFVTNRTNHRPQVADVGGKVDRPTSGSIKEGEGSPPPVSTVPHKGPVQVIAGVTHPSQRRKSPDHPRSPEIRSMTAKASPKANNLAEPDAVPARNTAASEKTLRVEMQTKDRNIRIIWFTHQPTEQDSPGKSKGI
jgi:anti-sigma factor RsiW